MQGAAARAVVAQGRRQGWLDDRACAKLWADHWARQGYAWTAVADRLRAKGLDEASIGLAGEELGLARADRTRAQELVSRWAAGAANARALERAARRLAARGYDAEFIDDVVAEWLRR